MTKKISSTLPLYIYVFRLQVKPRKPESKATTYDTSKREIKDEKVKVGKLHVHDFESAPEESSRVNERVMKYKEKVERSRKVLYINI